MKSQRYYVCKIINGKCQKNTGIVDGEEHIQAFFLPLETFRVTSLGIWKFSFHWKNLHREEKFYWKKEKATQFYFKNKRSPQYFLHEV